VAHSYTPGLKVTAFATLHRERKLPLAGTVVVRVGDKVTAETIVARTDRATCRRSPPRTSWGSFPRT
jgi:hypothetical protein